MSETQRIEFRDWAINQHDVVCNQKYDNNQPYSNHLKFVEAQARKFSHLLDTGVDRNLVFSGAIGHDLIEDARVTYNDVKDRAGYEVAEIIYACTESKGRNRLARHSQEYFDDLEKNDLAVYVKLCDIIANVTYSRLTNSGMLGKYRNEFPTIRLAFNKHTIQYQEMFTYLQNLLTI
jgi:(p)ppGpp synthase/HD superfamily hydrolase